MWFTRKDKNPQDSEQTAENSSAAETCTAEKPATRKPATRKKGAEIEQAAEHFLKRQGLKAVTRNYTIRGGEIDLIMRHGKVLVFVEVRYRASQSHGSGAESITHHKQQRLLKTARHYLQQHYGANPPDCRFDVMSGSGQPVQFEWLQNVFG
ncbi:YraN family protein [Thalassolituus alkanivorans]|uniref:YraN family protein n=1 Tax=Thalassolituus alkanivorans TaxID=2881055 RepID=UPI001E3A187E|nr:YraN family protein [Thalassolituus alkanivorans]MCB2387197.1 YraN family protein [Thalassolituus alkanivorans]MCB2422950.1 YraN family protein [Thalassolituus alkanivorans]